MAKASTQYAVRLCRHDQKRNQNRNEIFIQWRARHTEAEECYTARSRRPRGQTVGSFERLCAPRY